MSKSELRIKYKTLRAEITNREILEKKIYDRFTQSEMFCESETVFLYASSGSEVSTFKMCDYALFCGKKVAFPVCCDREGNMEFYYINSVYDLNKGMYGIMEPDTAKCKKAIPSEDVLLVVPGLSFDVHGYRLGYGKGYYDRFMKNFPGISVGLCFEECICDFLPVNAYDKKVNYLISDKKTYNFNITEEE